MIFSIISEALDSSSHTGGGESHGPPPHGGDGVVPGGGHAWRAARHEMAGAELVYGIDCPLPPALGAARLVAWYNVNRGEAQAEMRLFDL